MVESIAITDYVRNLEYLLNYKNIEEYIQDTAQKSCDFTPDIIAISLLFSASHSFFEKAYKSLKSIWPNAKVIVGGVHATNAASKLLDWYDIDYVIRGEAEISFASLIQALPLNKKIKIAGVYTRSNIKEASPLLLSPFIDDLDTIPFPDWDLIDMDFYTEARGRVRDTGKNQLHASLFTTRGCPFKCTFCSAHTVHGRNLRFRSVENIIEEMQVLNQKYGVSLFNPEDDLFTAKKSRLLQLLEKIKVLEIPDLEIQLPAGLSVNTLDEDIIDELIQAGVKIAVLAIESGSEHVQKNIIKKNCDLKKAKGLVKYLKLNKLTVRCYFILGFPGEIQKNLQETVDFAKSLKADWCVFNIATPLVGSEMYDELVQLGCIDDSIHTWTNTVFDRRAFDTKEIKADQLNDFLYRANLDCNFIHNPNMTEGNYLKAIDIFKDVTLNHPFHIIAWYCIMGCLLKTDNQEEADQIKSKIKSLIKSDKRAKDMWEKYNDLMPDLIIYEE